MVATNKCPARTKIKTTFSEIPGPAPSPAALSSQAHLPCPRCHSLLSEPICLSEPGLNLHPTWCPTQTNQRDAPLGPQLWEMGMSLTLSRSFSRATTAAQQLPLTPDQLQLTSTPSFLFSATRSPAVRWGSLGVGHRPEKSDGGEVDQAGKSPTPKNVRRRNVSVYLICPCVHSLGNGFRTLAFRLIYRPRLVLNPVQDCQRVAFRC